MKASPASENADGADAFDRDASSDGDGSALRAEPRSNQTSTERDEPKAKIVTIARSKTRKVETGAAEFMIAVRRAAAVLDDEGITHNEFIRFVAGEIGRESVSAKLKEDLIRVLRTAAHRGIIYTERGRLYADCHRIAEYPSELLKKVLLSIMGRTWWTREDATVAATRALGFERTGKNIKSAFKSAITGLLRQGKLEADRDQIRRT